MIGRAIYSHYSRPMQENNTGNAIGWYSEKHFWIGFALSVHFTRKWFGQVAFYSDAYGYLMTDLFGFEFTEKHMDLESLDLPASLWSIPKIYAIDKQEEPFLHIDPDVFLTKKLPERFMDALVLAQSYEPLDCYHFYDRGMKMFINGGFHLSYDFLYGFAKKVAPVNNGIVGGNCVWLFRQYCEQVFEMLDKNLGRFEDKPIPEYCVTLEQWLLNVACVRRNVELTVLLPDLNDAHGLGYKHYLAHSKRKRERCEKMELTAKSLIPEQLELIEEYFQNLNEYKIGRVVEAN